VTLKMFAGQPDIPGREGCGEIPEIVEGLLASYRELGGINHLEGANLPNREAIQGITDDLLKLVFPGFYEDDGLRSSAVQYVVGARITSLAERLIAEVERSLRYGHQDSVSRADAEQIVCRFLKSIPETRRRLALDVQAAYEGDPAAVSGDEVILAYPGLTAIAVQRLAHTLYDLKVPLIPRMMTEIAHSATGIDIHPGARIGEFFFIDHGTGVVIGETTEIGDRVKIYQGVTLGAKSFKKDKDGNIVKGGKRHPTIEDDVTIYAGATILGGDTVIGRGSVIGGNVWLLESVPPYSLVTYQEGETRKASLLGEPDLGGGI
jgi:serine O-acetyltransferase